MEISIYDAKANLSRIIQSLLSGEEKSIIITKNGKPVAEMKPFSQKKSKRIGIAKKELADFNMSLEEFNSLPIDDFYGDDEKL